MPITITQNLDLSSATQQFVELARFTRWKQAALTNHAAAALVIPPASRPADLGVDSEMLLIVLPDDLEDALPELALAELDVYNDISDDLDTSETMLTLQAGQVSIELDVRSLKPSFPGNSDVGWFYLGLAAGNRFVLSQHCLGKQWIESHQAGVQGACMSSGINYKPHRYWSQDALDAAARGQPPQEFAAQRQGWRKLQCTVVHVLA